MRNTITIGEKNTFDDWHMFSATKLVVNPPQPKLNFVDILGMNGSLDYTEALTKTPRYSDREGSWSFTILNPGDIDQYTIEMEGSYKYDWDELYSEVMSYLHGQYFDRIILDSDPYHTYRGRVWVNEAQSNSTWGQIVLNYRLKPFKYDLKSLTRTSVAFESGAITNIVTANIIPKKQLQPTPLHFYVTAPNYEVGTLRAVSVAFVNEELDIQTTYRFSGSVYDPETMEPTLLNKEVVIPNMLVSRLTASTSPTCSIAIGNVNTQLANQGPLTVDYWWEEASL